jgi:hypothetical protein
MRGQVSQYRVRLNPKQRKHLEAVARRRSPQHWPVERARIVLSTLHRPLARITNTLHLPTSRPVTSSSGSPPRGRGRTSLLDQLVAFYHRGLLVIITDNISTRTGDVARLWLANHPRVTFVFAPKHSSWLNQVEIWLGILTAGALTHRSLDSVRSLAKRHLPLRPACMRFLSVTRNRVQPRRRRIHAGSGWRSDVRGRPGDDKHFRLDKYDVTVARFRPFVPSCRSLTAERRVAGSRQRDRARTRT